MRPALIVLVVLVLLLALLWFGQRALIYFPDRSAPAPAASMLPGGKDLVLSTDDGVTLGAWLFRARRPRQRRHRPGGQRQRRQPNGACPAGRRSDREGFLGPTFRLSRVRRQPRKPVGRRPRPRRARRTRGDHRPRHLLRRKPGCRRRHPAGRGRSAARARAALALHRPGRGGIGELSLPAGAAAATRPVPGRVDPGRRQVPTVVVYGTADSIVPPSQSRDVAAAAGGPCTVIEIPARDHNDRSLLDGPELIQAVTSLVR